MLSITFAELTCDNTNFVVMEFGVTPIDLRIEQANGGLIKLLSSEIFHKPVVLVLKYCGDWWFAGDANIVTMAKRFNLDNVKWKHYTIVEDDSVSETEWIHY